MIHRHNSSLAEINAHLLARALKDAVDLVCSMACPPLVQRIDELSAGTLLAQCIDLCDKQSPICSEPIRTLHHFACTGGTLISKCLAALPNVQLLSEVDPLSMMRLKPGKPEFTPTDMVSLLRHSTKGANQDLLIELFRRQVQLVHQESVFKGQRLVIRDHAHGHFCVGPEVPVRPNLRALLPPDQKVLSVLTVRHPLDSFASLAGHGWANFQPGTLDEYCRRYLNFLDSNADVPVLRYEDFVSSPEVVMNRFCEILDLRYDPQFIDLFSAFQISGDSGRSSDSISSRPRRPAASNLQDEAQSSGYFMQLAGRLGYEISPADAAS